MIGVDWGTSGLRAYRLDSAGSVTARYESAHGILAVPAGDFAATLSAAIAPWLADGERRVLLSGMIGSRQGWVEAPYLPCPANIADVAARLVRVPFAPPFAATETWLVPGLSDTDAAGVPEVMRGEETQIFGALHEGGTTMVCLPGSHSKWARVEGGRITGFNSYLSGEAFAALRSATILGRMMTDAPTDLAGFDQGLARAGDGQHVLHHLFGVRTLGLFGRLADDASASYLSGLLIGHEVTAAMLPGATVLLIGAAPLCALYARAITRHGGIATLGDSDAAARGLHRIGRVAPWT